MCHVLIIEDHWLIAEHISCLATDGGATSVVVTATEHDAIQAAHLHQPAIILSDVNLLEGTGPRAVAAILAEYGPIPVIFITASPTDCHPCAAGTVILNKPVDGTAFLLAFSRLLST